MQKNIMLILSQGMDYGVNFSWFDHENWDKWLYVKGRSSLRYTSDQNYSKCIWTLLLTPGKNGAFARQCFSLLLTSYIYKTYKMDFPQNVTIKKMGILVKEDIQQPWCTPEYLHFFIWTSASSIAGDGPIISKTIFSLTMPYIIQLIMQIYC